MSLQVSSRWWFIVPALFLVVHNVQSTGDIVKVCNELNSGTVSNFQGLSAVDSVLYLMIQDRVYRIPMTEQYIDEMKGTVALYPRDQGFLDLGHWSTISWLHNFTQSTSLSSPTRFSLMVTSPKTKQILVHVVFQDGANLIYLNDTSTPMHSTFDPLNGFGLVADGTGSRNYLIIQATSVPEIYSASPVVLDGSNNQTPSFTVHTKTPYHLVQSVLNESILLFERIEFESSFSTQASVLRSSLVDGFITPQSKMVHLWDMKAKQVILFEDFGLNDAQEQSYLIPFQVVPFWNYFICSEKALEQESGFVTLLVCGLILVLVIGLGVGVFYADRKWNLMDRLWKSAQGKQSRNSKTPKKKSGVSGSSPTLTSTKSPNTQSRPSKTLKTQTGSKSVEDFGLKGKIKSDPISCNQRSQIDVGSTSVFCD